MTTFDRALLASYTSGVIRARQEYRAHPIWLQFDPIPRERPLQTCPGCPRRTRSVTGICQTCRRERDTE